MRSSVSVQVQRGSQPIRGDKGSRVRFDFSDFVAAPDKDLGMSYFVESLCGNNLRRLPLALSTFSGDSKSKERILAHAVCVCQRAVVSCALCCLC